MFNKVKLVVVILVTYMYNIFYVILSLMKLDTRQSTIYAYAMFCLYSILFEHFKLYIMMDMKIYLQVLIW